MKLPRQQERRERFEAALGRMPIWETWSTTFKVDTGLRDMEGERILEDAHRNYAKLIPRRLRRSMARDLSRKEYREARGLA